MVFSTWARHRLGQDFGEDPGEFRPERWEQLSGDMAGYIPFNKGPRICPGRKSPSVMVIPRMHSLTQEQSIML